MGLMPAGTESQHFKKGDAMKKYNLRAIMLKAWDIFRKAGVTFAEALHRAWLSAKAAAGITEETATWNEWKKAGYEVIHGSKALFGCDLVYGSKGEGAIYKARFFGRSQVQAITE